ncbi:probable acyltransferase-like protein At1g54570, chloroplastic [Coccomyxa sp. Obi]|nr:probable acyltransferase-like protein At1g54570, chloroplastic [Coccomyxa sp. Obi]
MQSSNWRFSGTFDIWMYGILLFVAQGRIVVQLLNPVATDKLGRLPPLVYCPGSDGTGNSIAPQLPGLTAAGFDVRCLYIPRSNRSDWDDLTREVVRLLRQLVNESSVTYQVTLVAESYGGCLGLRVAAAAPDLIQRLVLVNPATGFSRALFGLPSIIASSNLLSLFPAPLYQAAQAVLVPLLVDKDNVGPTGMKAIQSMMVMEPTPDFQPESGFVNVEDQRAQQRSTATSGPQLYEPAVTASWRLRMLRKGNVSDADLQRVRAPTLIVASAADRLLPSLEESARLVGRIPDARRVILPNSGHTALLESGISLAEIMGRTGFLPHEVHVDTLPATAHNSPAGEVTLPSSRVREDNQSAKMSEVAAARISSSNGAQSSRISAVVGESVSTSAVTATFHAGNGNAGLATSEETASSRMNSHREARNGSNGLSNGALQHGALIRDMAESGSAGSEQQASTQSQRQGSVWGQRAAGNAPPRKDTIDSNYEEALRLLGPLRNLVAPVVRGAENIPDGAVEQRACLFVGNHTRFGLYDLPFLMYELYLRGHKVRGLAHRAHWSGLPTGRFFERFGAVPASPRAAYKLLKQGDSVLLFPGGGREVNKLKGQEYQLLWREQPDFVRMAAKLNALIIPFSAVGGDDAFDLALDTREILENPILGPLSRGALERVAPGLDPEEAVPPLTRGLFGLPSPIALPKLERIYFRFMAPIDPNEDLCSLDDMDACMGTYERVRHSVEDGIQQLLAEREVDPERDLGPRLLGQAARFLPAFELLSQN